MIVRDDIRVLGSAAEHRRHLRQLGEFLVVVAVVIPTIPTAIVCKPGGGVAPMQPQIAHRTGHHVSQAGGVGDLRLTEIAELHAEFM
jgi:hypothetical protein